MVKGLEGRQLYLYTDSEKLENKAKVDEKAELIISK